MFLFQYISKSVRRTYYPEVWNSLRHMTSGSNCRDLPKSCDVLVVGGGAVGSSSAYHIKDRAGKDLSVVVLEQDPTYEKASTVLSLGNIRQQFSVPENFHLSMYSLKFIKKASELLSIEGKDPVDVRFVLRGYLFLILHHKLKLAKEVHELQTSLGAEVSWLWPDQIRKWYPWLHLNDNIAAGLIGTNNEGTLDPWSLLMGFRQKAISLGAVYLPAKLTSVDYSDSVSDLPTRKLTRAKMVINNGEEHEISFSTLVVAAGAWSGDVGRMAGVGTGDGLLATPIPVEPRKRFIYCCHAPNGPWKGCITFNDYTGMYFRPDLRPEHFLCSRTPLEKDEPDASDLSVDHSYFQTHIWPLMVERCPAFENLKVRSAWAGYYDHNTLDQNLILGFHPVYTNMCIATGMSGHGFQQSPAIGRAVMECVMDGRANFLNLDKFSFDRIINNKPYKEKLVL